MRMSNYGNLGAVVAQVMKTYQNEAEDYYMDGSGDCTSLIARGWDNTRLRLVQSFGFANFFHFMAVVERRTSARWIHFHGIH